MTARFSGQQWTELDSRDLTSFLTLTRVDTDQVQRRFIPDCGTILCQLQKTWSYQDLLYLKKKKRPPHLHSSPTWLAMSVLSSQTSALCPALAWMQEPPRSSPVRNPGRKAQVWTSNHSLTSGPSWAPSHRDRLSGCEEEKFKQRYLKLPARVENWKKVLYFTVACR